MVSMNQLITRLVDGVAKASLADKIVIGSTYPLFALDGVNSCGG